MPKQGGYISTSLARLCQKAPVFIATCSRVSLSRESQRSCVLKLTIGNKSGGINTRRLPSKWNQHYHIHLFLDSRSYA